MLLIFSALNFTFEQAREKFKDDINNESRHIVIIRSCKDFIDFFNSIDLDTFESIEKIAIDVDSLNVRDITIWILERYKNEKKVPIFSIVGSSTMSAYTEVATRVRYFLRDREEKNMDIEEEEMYDF